MYAALKMARLYAIAFIASGCTLVIELVAGRLLAPYIGVSLYTGRASSASSSPASASATSSVAGWQTAIPALRCSD